MSLQIFNMKNTLLTSAFLFFVLNANAYCRVDTVYNYNFPGNVATKVLKGRTIYIYNSDSTVATKLTQNYSAGFVDDLRVTYTYNTAKKVLSIIQQKYDVITSSWRNDSRDLYVYTLDIYINSKLYSVWNGTSWVFVDKYLYTRDASNRNIEEVYQAWQTSTSTWRDISRILKTYSSGVLINDIYQTYNTTSLVWDDYLKKEYVRNGLGQIIKTISYNAPPLTSTWDTIARNLYTYSGFNLTFETEERKFTSAGSWYFFSKAFQNINFLSSNIIERNYLEFDQVSGAWDSVQRNTFEYNSSGDVIAQDEFYSFNNTSFRYTNRNRSENSCRVLNVGIGEVSSNITFSIYPNPVSSGIVHLTTVEESDYTFSDLTGKQLQSGSLTGGENQIQLPSIAAGVYIMKVGHQTQKLIVQ